MKLHEDSLEAERLLEKGGVKPTSNRLLVLRQLVAAASPMSLMELEAALETMERSSVSRVLALLLRHDVVHSFEDGRGVTKYEICHGETHCSVDDMHAHFYCEGCDRTFCLEDVSAPSIRVPGDFRIRSVNYMLKGLCPDCSQKS